MNPIVANEKHLRRVQWVEETVSGRVSWRKRKIAHVSSGFKRTTAMGNSDKYRKQREVYREKRRLYAELSSLYRRMRQLHSELLAVHRNLNRYYRGDSNYSSTAREARQVERATLLSELAELSLEIQSRQATIVAIQHTKPTWNDRP
ncbi:MAG: hypothetical protein IAE80_12200 [Anaerolinea sp.]|nr:hypothetical protein [Anaerolinea sp.]